jgi:epoxyqueuosine reductase
MDFDHLKGLFESLGFCETALVSLDGPEGQALGEEGFQAAVMAALSYPCDEITDLSTQEDPHTLLAPFARANYYAEAVARLKKAAGKLREEGNFKKRDFRIFVNSRLPEKPLALAGGIGFQGKNSLIIVPGRGSLVVLAGMALPYHPSREPRPQKKPGSCGTCRRCVDACPTGAILPEGGLIRDRCLQEMSTGKMPETFWETWGTRLYGCQICQDVCPHNGNPLRETIPAPGRLGPSVSIRKILRSGTNLKQLFRGTVLDRHWITPEHLLRNSLIAAGNHPRGGVIKEEIEPYLGHSEEMISRAARWSLNRF